MKKTNCGKVGGAGGGGGGGFNFLVTMKNVDISFWLGTVDKSESTLYSVAGPSKKKCPL